MNCSSFIVYHRSATSVKVVILLSIVLTVLDKPTIILSQINILSGSSLLDIASQGIDFAKSVTNTMSGTLNPQRSSTKNIVPQPGLNILKVMDRDHNTILSSGLGLINKVSTAIGTKGTAISNGVEVVGKTTTDIISELGYNFEKHKVLSSGYYLQMERIINPLITHEERSKQVPVLIFHGLLEDSRSYVSTGRHSKPSRPPSNDPLDKGNRCLSFYLSNNNYDVWLLNARGVNEENSHHVPELRSEDYWSFSLDEMALEDLPRIVDFIREYTKKDKVAYVGYSMSTYLMFAKLSHEPEFADKILAFFALAPVVYMSNVQMLAKLAQVIPFDLFQLMSPVLTKGFSNILDFLLPGACGQILLRDSICRYFMSLVSGVDDTQSVIDESYYSHFPRPTSVKIIGQFGQGSQYGCFCKFNYGKEGNLLHYGQEIPPSYNVSKITLRTITLFRGATDHLSTIPDVARLLSELTVPLYEDHIIQEYNHIGYIYADNTYDRVNRHILRILDQLTLNGSTSPLTTPSTQQPVVQANIKELASVSR